MTTADIWIYALGFSAQLLFFTRMLIQWLLSEKAKKVVSPTIFWQLSLLGSFLFLIYGWLREDFAIILGQIIAYYIYIWNLNSKNQWGSLHFILRQIIVFMPIITLVCFFLKYDFTDKLFGTIPLGLILFGSAGQIVFTLRFVYQWWYSREKGESLLPAGFWILSLIGSFMIISYGIFRKDPVLILGQSVGFITYTRNLWLLAKAN